MNRFLKVAEKMLLNVMSIQAVECHRNPLADRARMSYVTTAQSLDTLSFLRCRHEHGSLCVLGPFVKLINEASQQC